MSDEPAGNLLSALCSTCADEPSDMSPSRRAFLAASTALAAGAAASLMPAPSVAQTNLDNDPGLRRLLAGRRILLKGGIVLTLDRQVGHFANADVMIENGKIAEIRPNIVGGPDVQLVDASNRIVIPGFVD